MNTRLSNRMLMNISLIDRGYTVADIGCDHGYVAIYLIENSIASHVIAMDVAMGPLSRAASHVEEAGLNNDIDVRLSDGADKLEIVDGKLEVDIILMAGIGGRLAIKLIENNIDKFLSTRSIVIQAQSELEYVRENLMRLGFSIIDEKMICEDGKYYNAIKAVSRKYLEYDKITDSLDSVDFYTREYSESELLYSRIMYVRKDEILREYLEFTAQGLSRIIAGIKSAGTDRAEVNNTRISELEGKLQIVKQLIDAWGD